MLLYQDILHVTILVVRSPKILALTIDRNESFVPIPSITTGSLPVPYLVSEWLSKSQTPLANRLIRDNDTPSCKDFFDISEAQGKAEVQAYGMADDLGRIAITCIRIWCRLHLTSILLFIR